MSLTAINLRCIRQDRLIFTDLGFSLKAGEILWVQGRNGAGKSSLLRMIAGLLKPVSGEIQWKGASVKEDPDGYQDQFRYIGHQEALKPVLSARENLQFWADFSGSHNVSAALKEFDLEKIADSPVGIMSAGQKKRTNLARLISSPAPLWILDEPISSLDTHYIELFKKQLEKHVAAGGMALLATHQDLNLPSVHKLDLDGPRGRNNE
ncbi:MAG: heme ABC exporter ATP-binding protein CcmA [Sneathiella sp.]|nr:heme ABC exporter ATP-binding protein CcmA [Sneathiella sp.]